MNNLGDCPYAGVCTCRASALKNRKAQCKQDAVRFCDGEKRKRPQSQKGIR